MICRCGWKYSGNGECPMCGSKPDFKTGIGMPNREIGRQKRISKVGKRRKRRLDAEKGEMEVFLEIWQTRDHVCQNLACAKKLIYFHPRNFHHIKTKGAHPELRLEKQNIVILCFACHDLAHQKGNSALTLPMLFHRP